MMLFRIRGWVATRAAKSTGIHGFKDKPDPAYKIDESMMPDFRGATMPIEAEKTRTMSAEQLGNMLFEGKDAIFSVNVCRLLVMIVHAGVLADESVRPTLGLHS